MTTEVPEPIAALIDTTNRADSTSFVALFTDDALLVDGGRRYRGRDGIRDWNRTDNIGVNSHLELTGLRPGSEPDSYVATVSVRGGGFNGTGTMTIVLRGRLIDSLRIS
jgi:hypothetical protein